MVLLESKITLKTGDAAPDFSLKGIDDEMHSLDSYAGNKGLLIIFMCNHCPYVKAKIDAIKQIHEKFNENIQVLPCETLKINAREPHEPVCGRESDGFIVMIFPRGGATGFLLNLLLRVPPCMNQRFFLILLGFFSVPPVGNKDCP